MTWKSLKFIIHLLDKAYEQGVKLNKTERLEIQPYVNRYNELKKVGLPSSDFFTNKTGTKRFAHICGRYVKPDAKTGFWKEHSTLAAFLALRRRAVLTPYLS